MKSKAKLVEVDIDIPDDLYNFLVAEAKRLGVSMDAIVDSAIRLHLAQATPVRSKSQIKRIAAQSKPKKKGKR